MPSTLAASASRTAASASRNKATKPTLTFVDYVSRFGGGPSTSPSLAPVASSSTSNSLSPLARTFPSLKAIKVVTPDRYEGKPLAALLKRHLPALKFHNPSCVVDVARWPQGARGKEKAPAAKEGEQEDAGKTGKKEKAKKVTLEFDNLVPREIIIAKKNEAQITREILDMCMFVAKSGGASGSSPKPTSATA